MAFAYSCLNQLKPASGDVDETLYTVPALTEIIISALHVSNVGGADDLWSVRLKLDGAADDDKQILFKGSPVVIADGFPVLVGYTLNAGDVLRVSSHNGNVSFSLHGCAIT
jgi:hypothetical protein